MTHSPRDEITAGLPTNNCCSTSASFALWYSTRTVLQKRHLIAAALIVSPQTGHGLSSLTSPPSNHDYEPPTTNHQPYALSPIRAWSLQPRAVLEERSM